MGNIMARFQNVLVGVDLSHGDWLCSAEGETPSHFACEQAVDLAAASNAAGHPTKLHFLAALDLDERTKWLLEQQPDEGDNVVHQAETALMHQVAAAAQDGVSATSAVVLGRSRVELLREARDGAHDLVMIGTRGHGLLAGVFMGSTALELLRKSTCPVWVVKPHVEGCPQRILVGTDFSPVCNVLFDYGVELAELFNAELHVTHVVESAKRPFLQFSQVDEQAIQIAHQEAIDRARSQLDALAARQDVAALARPLQVHLEEGVASTVISEQTREFDIDLLMVGTVAWAGVPGLVIGSTAHKLLPELSCSLLTMRPEQVD
jgi:universal stress protein E